VARVTPGIDAGDVKDPKLPGGSLLDAIFSRRLMSWSDRGRASMLLGECWAERCHQYLVNARGRRRPVPGETSFELRAVIRLDDDPKVEREANLNQLENPDFLLIGLRDDQQPVVQAADAKFAADRIKESQVSAAALEDLLYVPITGATRALLHDTLEDLGFSDPEVLPGVFLSPDSPFTDMLIERALRQRGPVPRADLVVRTPVDPGELFDGLPEARLLSTLARIDHLPVSPQDNLLAAVYYFRLACACFYFWDEQTRPLFGVEREGRPVEAGLVAAEVSRRASAAASAHGVLVSWHRDLRDVMMARSAVSDAVVLPVGIAEVRERVARLESSSEAGIVRRVRRDLDVIYRSMLVERVGAIYPDDPRPLAAILKDVRARSRELRPEMLKQLERLVREAGSV
jgi:hypothetical protein